MKPTPQQIIHDLSVKLEQAEADCAILNEDVRELVSALDRLHTNVCNLLRRVPVRDLGETMAEAVSVLAKHSPEKS